MMNFNNSVSYYPARYSLSYSNVVAVGSTNPDDSRTAPFFWSATSGSNYGTHINVVAPGNFIYGLNHLSNTDSNSYWGGTSQATPLVAGIASLMLAQNPSLTPLQLRTILQNTSQDQVGDAAEDAVGFDQYMGYGRVNAFAALQATTLDLVDSASMQQEFALINPIQSNELQLYSKGKFDGEYTIIIYTIDGKELSSSVKNLTEGVNALPFDFANGNYILSLKSDSYSKVFKVTKR
jgi:subtilisin family serine protease